jgi:trehalose/maltose transport system substrate-binding protein
MTRNDRAPIHRRTFLTAGLAAWTGTACRSKASPTGFGGPRLAILIPATERPVWAPVVAAFQDEHGVAVDLVEGPNATDLRENLYTAALLAGDDSFDLVYMDVTWTPKFAAAGWLLPLDDAFRLDELEPLLPAAVEAGRYRSRLYRIPTRTDVGLIYYRRDWLEAAGWSPPATFDDLARMALALQSPPARWGFVWPGSQYEGLVCVYLEALHGHGGFWIDPVSLEVGLERPEARAALDFLRRCREEPAISPPGVTTYKEEESRRLFQDGRAAFLRSWSYVWRLAQAEGSAVAGRVGVQPLVHAEGGRSAGTLGGWGLGVSTFSRRLDLAREFIRHAVTLESQRVLGAKTGYAPSRTEAYEDPALLTANPFLRALLPIHATAAPRPAVARYAFVSDVLQRHVSDCLTGRSGAEEALRRAARETRLALGEPGGVR